jgi:hypothetical protein
VYLRGQGELGLDMVLEDAGVDLLAAALAAVEEENGGDLGGGEGDLAGSFAVAADRDSLRIGEVERSVAGGVEGVRVCSGLQEELGQRGGALTVAGGVERARLGDFVQEGGDFAGATGGVGSGVQQHTGGGHVALSDSVAERGHAVAVLGLEVGAVVEQELGEGGHAQGGGAVEGGAVLLAVALVRVGTGFEEVLDAIDLVLEYGLEERGQVV